MSKHVSSYEATRTICYIVSGIGWLLVVIGLIATAIALRTRFFAPIIHSNNNLFLEISGFLGISGGISIIFSGMLFVLSGQFVRSSVDSTDHSGEILDILKDYIQIQSQMQAIELTKKVIQDVDPNMGKHIQFRE